MPRTPLHDGAVIIRGEPILAAGALLPLAEMTVHTERFGTRHRAALGITEQTDAVVVVVSEENSQVSLVERARIVRNLNEPQLTKALAGSSGPAERPPLVRRGSGAVRSVAVAGREPPGGPPPARGPAHDDRRQRRAGRGRRSPGIERRDDGDRQLGRERGRTAAGR